MFQVPSVQFSFLIHTQMVSLWKSLKAEINRYSINSGSSTWRKRNLDRKRSDLFPLFSSEVQIKRNFSFSYFWNLFQILLPFPFAFFPLIATSLYKIELLMSCLRLQYFCKKVEHYFSGFLPILLKIENNSLWVNFPHFLEKMHILTFELIFISSRWWIHMHIKFDI